MDHHKKNVWPPLKVAGCLFIYHIYHFSQLNANKQLSGEHRRHLRVFPTMISASVACLTIICKYDFVSFINSLMIQGMQSLAWRNSVVMRVALNSGQGLFCSFYPSITTSIKDPLKTHSKRDAPFFSVIKVCV